MYDHKKIESKWQKRWARLKTFQPDLDKAKKPFYNLMMFPYPSAEGLHVGHTYAFGGADAYGRFKRLQGYDVFEPMGFDAFGIHSENFAIKKGLHPKELIKKTTAYFREKQMKRYGGMWDWSRQVDTTKPEYYQWTQWIFVQFFKNGLVERKKTPLNWCPSCKTVLSDEQVEPRGGQNVCERCKAVVERKETEQWFFKITDYAQRLLDYHGTQWPETTRRMQTNWIGKSEGINFREKVKGMDIEFEVYDSAPQTFTAQTFTIIAPEHPLVEKLVKGTKYEKKVMDFVATVKKKKLGGNYDFEKDPEGVFTGRYVEDPFGKGDLPIWVASFVVYEYGTGVVNCSAHDDRDFEFAKKYKLPLRITMLPPDKKEAKRVKNLEYCYHHVEEGIIQDPEEFKGINWKEAREPIIDYIKKKSLGRRTTHYKLRDWCISRQRYWGPPIPMIYCPGCAKKGESWFTIKSEKRKTKSEKLLSKEKRLRLTKQMPGWYPESEESLPVELPYVKNYQPKGKGKSPLAEVKSFYQVECPHCGQPARRETDVSDTFLDSAWYFLRYPSTEFKNEPFDKKRTQKWLPVDMYIGGNEHACLHLLYSRFVTMALHDLGYFDFQEPFKRFFAHGLIIKDGAKMSKSRGNVVNPEEYMDKYGADALRMYLLFLGPINQGGDFRDTGMQGMHRFLKRFYQLAIESAKNRDKVSPVLLKKLHQTIKKVNGDLEKLRFNTAIAALMELTNVWQSVKETANKDFVGIVARLVAPFAPYLAEEFWEMVGGKFSVLDAGWPKYDPDLIREEKITIVVQINGRLRDTLKVDARVAKFASKKDKELVLKIVQRSAKVQKHLKGKKIKKTIFVPGRLVNLVV